MFSDLHQNCKSMRNHIASCFASRYPSLVGIVDDLVTLFLKNVVKLDSVEALCCGPGCMYNIANDH